MENTIHELALQFLINTEHLHQDWQHKYDYAFSPELLALSHVWKARDRNEYVVASKGAPEAPEAIADLCHFSIVQLTTLNANVIALAGQGLRVLGVAHAIYKGEEWPQIQHDFEF
jgi:Ca2+-transporting ATPase